jgi:hypothetical protein
MAHIALLLSQAVYFSRDGYIYQWTGPLKHSQLMYRTVTQKQQRLFDFMLPTHLDPSLWRQSAVFISVVLTTSSPLANAMIISGRAAPPHPSLECCRLYIAHVFGFA